MRLAWVRGNWSSRGPPPGPGWRNPSRWRTIPPPMSLLAFLLVAQTATQDTVPPYLAFPEPGLDDPAAYEGYDTRVYQDASHNAFQIYLKGNTGRVVNLWADAANESVGFTVRDSIGKPAGLAWGSSGALVTGSAHTRSVSYALELPTTVRVGLFLLGSMRVERDFQYAGHDTLPLDAPPFTQAELVDLIDHVAKLKPAERTRHLSLLGVKTIDALRARLAPSIALNPALPLSASRRGGRGVRTDTTWTVEVEQESFDGKNHLRLALEGDARETVPTLSGSIVTVRRPAGGPVRLTVRVTTDAPALVPLRRAESFNEDFQRFAAQVRADTAHPLTSRRLEREVRGVELLCYREKLMAGLPNFATYFGRDMLMTALLMQPVWAPAMSEHVVASALGKLSPTGDVSHEEALGGQAIRENAAEYNRLVSAGQLARARALLAHLAATRENYIMVDDDFQLPVVAARYLADPRVPADRKRGFLRAQQHLARLVSNLAFVVRKAAPYARDPVATNLVSFPRASDGSWISASWRDSHAGYGGGRFAMDVNAIWVPHALEAVGTILDALTQLGVTPVIREEPLAAFARDRAALQRAVATWKGAERHFRVALARRPVADRVAARLRWLPPTAGEYWNRVAQRTAVLADTLRFLALSLDAAGRPIPIVNTDPAMLQRVSDAVDRSGLRHAELWSYTIENGRLVPSRYGTSSDVQLWSLTDLAVQYLLNHPTP